MNPLSMGNPFSSAKRLADGTVVKLSNSGTVRYWALPFTMAVAFSGTMLFSQEKKAAPVSTALTISSEGELKVMPEKVQVAIHFTGYGWTVEKSKKKVDSLIQKFKQKLAREKILPKEMEIGEVRLKPSYQFNRDLKKNLPSNFLATRRVLLHLSDKNSFTKLMDISLSIGSFVLEHAKLTVADKKELSQKVFERALEEAKTKAEALAKSMGKKVQEISNIVEEGVFIEEINLIQEMGFATMAAAALSEKEQASEIEPIVNGEPIQNGEAGTLSFPEEPNQIGEGTKFLETKMEKGKSTASDQISARARLRITYLLQ